MSSGPPGLGKPKVPSGGGAFLPSAWVGGRVLPVAEATVPLEDRGFLFGEAVYEVFLTRNGRAFAREDHLERLARSARGIGLDPARFRSEVEVAVQALLAISVSSDGLLYVQVTGGAGPRDHLPPPGGYEPLVVATHRPFDPRGLRALQERGAKGVLASDNRWPLATYKTTQLLGAVLAKKAARERGADEALFYDRDRFLLEGGSTNVFVVRDGRAVTPPLTRNILPGITRALLLKHFPERTAEADVAVGDLPRAEEVFIASTTRPVVAVVDVDGRSVGSGAPGPVTRELAAGFAALMARELGG